MPCNKISCATPILSLSYYPGITGVVPLGPSAAAVALADQRVFLVDLDSGSSTRLLGFNVMLRLALLQIGPPSEPTRVLLGVNGGACDPWLCLRLRHLGTG